MLLWILGAGALLLQAYCLIDAVRHRQDAFPATGNQTKIVWLVLLVVSAIIGFLSLPGNALGDPLNLFNLLAVVIPGVYLARVRPAIVEITGGRGR